MIIYGVIKMLKSREETPTQNCGRTEQYRRCMREIVNLYLEGSFERRDVKTDCKTKDSASCEANKALE